MEEYPIISRSISSTAKGFNSFGQPLNSRLKWPCTKPMTTNLSGFRVCAWCRKILGMKPELDGLTHGICTECKTNVEQEANQ